MEECATPLPHMHAHTQLCSCTRYYIIMTSSTHSIYTKQPTMQSIKARLIRTNCCSAASQTVWWSGACNLEIHPQHACTWSVVSVCPVYIDAVDHLTAGNLYTLSNHYSADFKLNRFDDKLQHLKLVFGSLSC